MAWWINEVAPSIKASLLKKGNSNKSLFLKRLSIPKQSLPIRILILGLKKDYSYKAGFFYYCKNK